MAKSIEQLTQDIKQRAEADPLFLQKLIVDPQAAGAEANGGPLPERMIVRLAFHGTTPPPNVNDDPRIIIWLPNPDVQLTEAELEAVTGGTGTKPTSGGTSNTSCGDTNVYCPGH